MVSRASMPTCPMHARGRLKRCVRRALYRGGPGQRCYRQAYALSATQYAGLMIGLVLVYQFPRDMSEDINFDVNFKWDLSALPQRDVGDVYLSISRDEGTTWDLQFVYRGTPFLQRVPLGTGSTLQGWVQPASEFITWQDRHWIYASGFAGR
jgi:hypothetical protein